MTLVGCGIQPNITLNFGPNTRLIMDISLIHVYDSNHRFKISTIRDTKQRKRCKYADFYQRQGFAFAPMICNTLGECGPDMLHFLWNLADRSARHHFGFHPIEHGQDLMSQSTDHDRDFRKLRGKLFNDYRHRLQTAIFEAVTMRVYGHSFALTCSANYRTWIRTLQTEWHPLFPLDVPLDSQHSSSVPQVQESHNRLWQAEDVHDHLLSKRVTNCRGGLDDMFPLRRALREMLPIRLLAWIGSCNIL